MLVRRAALALVLLSCMLMPCLALVQGLRVANSARSRWCRGNNNLRLRSNPADESPQNPFPTWKPSANSIAEQIKEARELARKEEEDEYRLIYGSEVDALNKNETLLSIAAKRNGTTFDLGDARNYYVDVVMKLTPNELISRFMSLAPPSVLEAARSSVTNLIGDFSGFALETSVVTTGRKLATVMLNMQMTGYMFKNAEYRLSLKRSLSALPYSNVEDISPPSIDGIPTSPTSNPSNSTPTTQGEIVVKTQDGKEMRVRADDLTNALSREVEALRDELALVRKQLHDNRNMPVTNMLSYVKSLPEEELKSLTNQMSSEVLEAIQMLVDAVMSRVVGITDRTGGDVLLQQSGSGLAQLCMWQLALGYSLRDLEVQREEGMGSDDIQERFVKQGTDTSRALLQQFTPFPMAPPPPAPEQQRVVAENGNTNLADKVNVLRNMFLRRLGLDPSQVDSDGETGPVEEDDEDDDDGKSEE